MSFLWDWNWWSGFLRFIGFNQKSAKLLLLGLDNAGKTTMLHLLKEGLYKEHVPTWHPTTEDFVIGGLHIKMVDLGGHEQARRVWSDYFLAVDAVVYVVDTADHQRFLEAKHELLGLLSDPQIAHCPILVLGNKIDKFGSVSEEYLKLLFEIANICTGKGKTTIRDNGFRPIEVFMCSLAARQGYGEAFRWLATQLD